MTQDSDSNKPARRDIFRFAGAASALTLGVVNVPDAQAAAAPETLSAAEFQALEAFCARLIPTDAMGPGATEAGAAHYIDRALGGALAESRPAYAAGLAAMDAYARTAKGVALAGLAVDAQDAILTLMEKNTAFPDSGTFFALVRGHVMQGMFGDPYYGGNEGFLGWTMLGYPGIRLAVTKEDQAMSPHLTPVLKSAYDFPMFDKAGAAAAVARPAPVSESQMPDGMGTGGMAGMGDMSHDH